MPRALATLLIPLVLALPARGETFDGPYAGVDVSYVRGTPNLLLSLQPPARPVRVTDILRLDGLEYGGFAGYRRAVPGGAVLGVELGLNLGSVEDRRTTVTGGPPGDFRTRLQRRGEVSLSLRAGHAVTPTTLLYGFGGVQAARFELGTGTAGGDRAARRETTRPGWHAGLGAERALGDSLSIRAEYRYRRFGDLAARAGTVTVRARPDESSIRIGAVWRF